MQASQLMRSSIMGAAAAGTLPSVEDSALSSEQFLHERLANELDKLRAEVPSLSRQLKVMQVSLTFLQQFVRHRS